MIPTDYPVALACGSVASLLQARYIRIKRPVPLTGRVAKVGAAAAAAYALGVGYFMFMYPAWMYAYAADPARLSPALAYALFLPTMVLTGWAAAHVSQTLIETDRLLLAVVFAGGSLALVGLSIVALQDAFLHVGTFAEWCAGTAPSFQDAALDTFRAKYNTFGAILGVAGAATVGWLVRENVQLGKLMSP